MKEEEIRKRSVFNEYLKLTAEDVSRLFSDKKSFIQIDCPACGSKKYQVQFEKIGFTYVLCRDCGTLFVNPRPLSKLLTEFYTRSRSTSFFVNDFFMPVAEVRREKIFLPRAEYIRDILPAMSKGIVGDIGAGFGIFLEELGKFWPSARLIAIEPSIEMVDICKKKGLEVIPSSLEDVQSWDSRFDLLVSFELFEHLYNPDVFLKKIRHILRPGGYLFITTLNGEGFDIQIFWEKSKSISPPQHLNFFNPQSISRLLEANNFLVEKADTPGKLDWDIVEGMYREDGFDPGRFWRLVADKAGAAAKDDLQEWISSSGLSSHMRILAKRKG